MRATELLTVQFNSAHAVLHDIADDLTPDELTTRVVPNTNLLAFDLWHVARTQDWALQTLVRGVPELLDDPRWQGLGSAATYGIGVGLTEAQADDLARMLKLADMLAYANATHTAIVSWLAEQSDGALTQQPDVPAHLERYPVYKSEAMREEVPWMYQQPFAWRCLAPALGHFRDHLAVMELLKNQARAH